MIVGSGEGIMVGVTLGATVGFAIGAVVGLFEGVALGVAVVGALVGITVGVTLGLMLGLTVSVKVGFSVGSMVGVADGGVVGVAVGLLVMPAQLQATYKKVKLVSEQLFRDLSKTATNRMDFTFDGNGLELPSRRGFVCIRKIQLVHMTCGIQNRRRG